ncbi:unannotated protein [freshwater metagenome]|uniref:Unannotated protein n=1 Tax=freshwater metagenome TaxID=449393 RepID=A0A6J6KW25_9ZZZZ
MDLSPDTPDAVGAKSGGELLCRAAQKLLACESRTQLLADLTVLLIALFLKCGDGALHVCEALGDRCECLQNFVFGVLISAKIVVLALHHLELGFERYGVIRPSGVSPPGDEPANQETETHAKREANQYCDDCFVHVPSLPVTPDPHTNLH